MISHSYHFLFLIVSSMILIDFTGAFVLRSNRFRRGTSCDDSSMCRSQWGFCGYGPEYCGDGCQAGPCLSSTNNNNGDIITEQRFQCVFNGLDQNTRSARFDGLNKSGWKPQNPDEAAVFLAHVYHETDGLKTLTEYCAPNCNPVYSQSWCDIQPVQGKSYYGRGWFQLSYPCNYNAAGKALGLDLLSNPDWVSEQEDIAVKTAIWFYQTNHMDGPAQRGDFAATTRILNGPQECDGGPGANNQRTRVATYERVRLCFDLGKPTINPMC